ncbi:MAG: hypothetical protein ACREB7_10530 [Sphingopyxis sp.]|uniref:hypothetical protein n=1 Tax=Sphingopyxis sp. TaxID=1908224 RepID=UPI003D6D46BA
MSFIYVGKLGGEASQRLVHIVVSAKNEKNARRIGTCPDRRDPADTERFERTDDALDFRSMSAFRPGLVMIDDKGSRTMSRQSGDLIQGNMLARMATRCIGVQVYAVVGIKEQHLHSFDAMLQPVEPPGPFGKPRLSRRHRIGMEMGRA